MVSMHYIQAREYDIKPKAFSFFYNLKTEYSFVPFKDI